MDVPSGYVRGAVLVARSSGFGVGEFREFSTAGQDLQIEIVFVANADAPPLDDTNRVVQALDKSQRDFVLRAVVQSQCRSINAAHFSNGFSRCQRNAARHWSKNFRSHDARRCVSSTYFCRVPEGLPHVHHREPNALFPASRLRTTGSRSGAARTRDGCGGRRTADRAPAACPVVPRAVARPTGPADYFLGAPTERELAAGIVADAWIARRGVKPRELVPVMELAGFVYSPYDRVAPSCFTSF